jgi:hypothetical protein
MPSRLDIRISEQGTENTTKEIEEVASTLALLSPEAAKSLRGVALRVGISTDKLVKDVAVAVLDRVVHASPHDTGQFRAGWVTSISSTLPSVRSELGKLDYDGDATVAEGTATILTTNRAPGQSVFITNTHDYAEALNNGHSKQAAAGFVELATQVGAKVASDAAALKRGLK